MKYPSRPLQHCVVKTLAPDCVAHPGPRKWPFSRENWPGWQALGPKLTPPPVGVPAIGMHPTAQGIPPFVGKKKLQGTPGKGCPAGGFFLVAVQNGGNKKQLVGL